MCLPQKLLLLGDDLHVGLQSQAELLLERVLIVTATMCPWHLGCSGLPDLHGTGRICTILPSTAMFTNEQMTTLQFLVLDALYSAPDSSILELW